MDTKALLASMTIEEKARLLTGAASMSTAKIERLGIAGRRLADGPHGLRTKLQDHCTSFPTLCTLASSWNKKTAFRMGQALAAECLHRGISMILGPGINIKRTPLCGRNFEYMSEDPVLSGEMAAGYINGLESCGVGACLKHFAANNQEVNRAEVSVNVEERVLRELYLKGFEIALKKSSPAAVMCSYNKINSVWSSENPFLLKEVLREEWQYDGMVVSDWGAVHDVCRALAAGLDLQMPPNKDMEQSIKQGLAEQKITEKQLDQAVLHILDFVFSYPEKEISYDRTQQHQAARDIAADSIVLLKNEKETLPLSADKHKKIVVMGEFAHKPLICGHGSSQVLIEEEAVDSPVEELRKRMPQSEITYLEYYKKGEYPTKSVFSSIAEFRNIIKDVDAVILFIGDMESDNAEISDKRTIRINPKYELFIQYACKNAKQVIVVIQSGGAVILDEYCTRNTDAIVEMGLGGEGAGSAIADVLCGNINPSGKLSETFPKAERRDLEYPGTNMRVVYKEGFDVGYRYYDKHPEEIAYPFGHGLSYTEFSYRDLSLDMTETELHLTFYLQNIGRRDGSEVYQIYVGNPYGTLERPIKELKYFDKVTLRCGEEKKIEVSIPIGDLAQYNTMLHQWVTECGRFDVYVGSSSQDIRLMESVFYQGAVPYSIQAVGEDMIG